MPHAIYSSDDDELADVENVLMTYNLGTGAIAAAARFGIVLERNIASATTPSAGAHHLSLSPGANDEDGISPPAVSVATRTCIVHEL